MDKDPYMLSSVSHALEILDHLSENNEAGVAEISKNLNMGKASVFRLLYTLVAKDFVYKTSNSKYRLSTKFVHYGSLVLERQDLLVYAKPFLKSLRDLHNETTHCGILDDDNNVIFIDKELSDSSIQMSSRIGLKMPAYCTGNGKVLLSGLPDEELEERISNFTFNRKTDNTITNAYDLRKEIERVRISGFGQDCEECEIGLVCFAAPIRNIYGSIVASISISGPTGRMMQNRNQLIESVKNTANEISKTMGHDV
ncbi:MAG: IclR family transcriptional regulator [Eubacteriales bacterium]